MTDFESIRPQAQQRFVKRESTERWRHQPVDEAHHRLFGHVGAVFTFEFQTTTRPYGIRSHEYTQTNPTRRSLHRKTTGDCSTAPTTHRGRCPCTKSGSCLHRETIMTYVVASLFDHPDKANEAMHALERSGFDARNIESIESDPESQSFLKRVFSSEGGEQLQAEKTMDFMTGMGIPKDEAQDYAQKVKKGQSLLLINCDTNAEAKRARNILDRYPFEEAEEQKDYGVEQEHAAAEEFVEAEISPRSQDDEKTGDDEQKHKPRRPH